MTFISYAQNFEDIMLWRALKHVEKGFYIDVGANDPVVDSVTHAFYERGWRGINIEPMRQYYAQLCAQRPEDINLPVAAGDVPGNLPFFDIPDTGLSTIDAAIAEKHKAEGGKVLRQDIEVCTLADICEQHARGPIHFLKIDVEGFEEHVIRGMDFQHWRPWILVVEATRPRTQITTHHQWENLVLGNGYQFAYFDGLNHYYIANEHADLLQFFKAPPNFFDDFRLRPGHYYSYPLTEFETRTQQAEARAWNAEAQAQHAITQAAQIEEKAREAKAEANRIAIELAAVYASTSWRLTRPVRAVKSMLRHPVRVARKLLALTPSPKALVKKILGKILRWTLAQRRLRTFALRSLSRFPALDARVRTLVFRLRSPSSTESASMLVPENLKNLPESARKIYADLQRAIAKQN